jgi:Ca-activated chloride channel homolog
MMRFPNRATFCGLVLFALGIAACNQTGAAPGSLGTLAPGLVARNSAAGAGMLPPCRPGTDELWVFAEGALPAAATADGPGGGQLLGRDGAGMVTPLPLQHTDVKSRVRGYVSLVDLTQRFHNPYAEKIEAIYVFPLPDDAAVRDFVLQIGERQIRGIVRKRAEARAIYEQAKAEGFRASLLEQARPNVFEQAIANLEPGKSIDVRLRYVHTLAYASGSFEFVFPMVVGPRYNPPGWRDGIGVAPAHQNQTPSQPTSVGYLPPNERPANDVAVSIDVDAGMPIGDIQSPSHAVTIERSGPNRATVQLAAGSTIPNRDFVLRFAAATAQSTAAMFTGSDATGGYLTMLVEPPPPTERMPRLPVELVFLLDCSGSMDGVPLQQVKAAVEMALQPLGPQDSIQIIRFSDAASALAPRSLPATPPHLALAKSHLQELHSEGGTEMLSGIRAALGAPADPERQRCVFFLTDGYIGNEVEVFAAVRQQLGSSRIFALGVGSAVNRYLLEGVARLGRGGVGYLLHDEAPGQAVAQLFERIRHPALRDLAIDWGGADVSEVFPARLPDLLPGRPLAITARFRGEPPSHVELRGRVGNRAVALPVAVQTTTDETLATSLPALWARRKIQSLSDFAELEGRAMQPTEVEQLALGYGLMSAYTSFLAVDSSGRTAGTQGTTVHVPVPMPAGVKYQTPGSGH